MAVIIPHGHWSSPWLCFVYHTYPPTTQFDSQQSVGSSYAFLLQWLFMYKALTFALYIKQKWVLYSLWFYEAAVWSSRNEKGKWIQSKRKVASPYASGPGGVYGWVTLAAVHAIIIIKKSHFSVTAESSGCPCIYTATYTHGLPCTSCLHNKKRLQWVTDRGDTRLMGLIGGRANKSRWLPSQTWQPRYVATHGCLHTQYELYWHCTVHK